jgi:PAT family beta-lactamase induction signal transducer AmpG
MATVLMIGFFSGFPLAVTGSSLQAWMTREGFDLKTVGLFGLVAIAYPCKFIWAPLMDRFVPPFLGRRRGWLLVTQLAIALSILAMSFMSPRTDLVGLAIAAVLTAFFSASQDIVADAYRTDVLHADEFGPGGSIYVAGYRIAMIVTGALALILSDHMPWPMVYRLLAGVMSLAVFVTLFAPEPTLPPGAPKSLREAVILPFGEFFRRKGSIEVVLFTTLYKLDAVMTLALMTPFLLKLGFTGTEIGVTTKGFGLTGTMVGTLLGGFIMVKLGLKRSLWVFGFTQAISGLSFWALAHFGHHYPLMVTAIVAENFCSGMGNAAYAAFLMSMCDRRYTATQYALFSSLFAVTRTVLGAPTGFLVESVGWETYYVICTFASVPAFLLLLRYDRWQNHLAEAK